MIPKTQVMREISLEWGRLMQVAKRIEYGEARVVFQDGEPIRIETVIKKISLKNEEDFKNKLSTIPII